MRSVPAAALSLLLCSGCGSTSAASDPKPPVAVTEVSLDAESDAGSEASAESDPSAADAEALEQARAAGVLGALTDDEQAFAAILGSASIDGDIGGLEGATVGEAFGTGGLGLRGTGTGGGGTGEGTIGLGSIGTRGGGLGAVALGTGSGFSGYGSARASSVPTPQVHMGVPAVQGALDPQIVRRVLLRHAAQLRYCYAKEQAKLPQLAGTLAVTFAIGPSGEVTAASIAGTTLQNTAVETCVSARLRSMAFPAPERGVVDVVVTLDFKTPPPPPPPVAPPPPPASSGAPP